MAKFIDLDTGLPALLNKVKAWVQSKIGDLANATTTALAGKQDTISDLATIRTGAGKGATAIQGIIVGGNEVTPDANRKVTIPAGADGKSAYQSYLDTTSDSPVKTEAEWVASLLPTVVSNGDMAIVESEDYIDIFIYEAEIATTPTVIALDGEAEAHKSATLNVVGSHLKADIVVSVPTGFYVGSTGTATSATLTATNGSVDTSVVIRHNGSNPNTDITGVAITLTSGSLTKTVPLSYTRYAGPTIIADAALTVKAAAGGSNTATLSVSGVNLTGNITAAISGTNASKFSVSGSPITQSGGSASGTLTITYSPSSGDTSAADASATLTLSSTGATSIQVALTGKVSELTVSKQSISISTDQGVAATDTFTVSGVNLTEGVTIAKTDANGVFSVSPSSITKASAENNANTITVTYQSANAGTHTGLLAVTSGGVTKTVSLSGTAEAAAALDSNGRFKKDGIYYGAISDGNDGWTDEVKVYNSQYSSAADSSNTKYSGALNIPSTVSALKNGVATEFTVKGVHDYAFRQNTAITSITLPNTVTSLPAHVIYFCSGLTYLDIGGLTQFSYDFGAGCSSLETLVIGDSMEDLTPSGGNLFGYNSSLRTVVLGASVKYIGQLFHTAHATAVTTIICRKTVSEVADVPIVNSNTSFKITNAANMTVYIPTGMRSYYIQRVDGINDVIQGISDGKLWKYFDDNSRLIEGEPNTK